jgi:hypothetical protein
VIRQAALAEDRRKEAAARAEAERRAREAEEERDRQEREEAQRQAREREREAALKRKRERLPPEPVPPEPAFSIRLQFPNGSKVARKFSPTDPLQAMRDFIDLYVADNNLALVNYSMSANFPKRTFEDLGVNLQDAQLHSADTIYIQDLDA